MSRDVVLESAEAGMGTKEEVREAFLSACKTITGTEIQRRGPTEVAIDPLFRYEVYFVGHKRAIESMAPGQHLNQGDPHDDPTHPVWSFLRQVHELTGWRVVDTSTGQAIGWSD